jgi:hypothetical protein
MEKVEVCEPRDTARGGERGVRVTRGVKKLFAESWGARAPSQSEPSRLFRRKPESAAATRARAEVIETTPGTVPGIAHLARQTRYGFS